MRKTLAILCAAAAMTMLAGCVTSNGYPHGRVSYTIGYYDGFYGPYAGGYWSNGYFYYLGRDRHYHRDDGHHFRRNNFAGGHRFRAEDRDHDRSRGRGHDQDRDHDRGR